MDGGAAAKFEKTYNPGSVEGKWYEFWIEKGYFTAPSDPKSSTFSIVIPPPNITGSLHIGHALNNTLQDTLVRYRRMKGMSALWVPGTDHAGIATQMVVERDLEASSLTRHDLGREAFVNRVWQWKRDSGGKILTQLHRLGASADWEKERFTMDEGLSFAVKTVFVELYKQGLIYKDKRLVNWDPKLHTAISDLEVEQRKVKGRLWYFRYPIEDGGGRYITVATTRPETMLGDVAVAVHPEDERYSRLVGKSVVLPLVGRRIPIIADEYSDPEKGTGAVKITPAHDFNDFEVGRRHKLDEINIFDRDASLNENAPEKYRGLDRHEAREAVVMDMEKLGLVDKVTEHVHVVPYGDRSGVVIEPWLTDQWYVDAKALAAPAIEAVEQGRIKFIPERCKSTYFEWMRNIQPWCVSRQIWWGHRIPAWYGPDGKVFVELSEVDAGAAAKEHYGVDIELSRDEDVLDTWFSSALWPFSALGWPEKTSELRNYYPTSVLVTGFDIIFFWVARMIMMGLKFMGEVPFREVYIHGLIRDEKGEKMSKTKGNVIDPLDIMGTYGADSLRFALTALATQGRDIKLSIAVIEGYRNFMNKIWNASRFLFLNLGGYTPGKGCASEPSIVDRWILTRLNYTVREVESSLGSYEFDKVARTIYQFIWGEFCDWYIELVKPVLTGEDTPARYRTQSVLIKVLLNSLQLLHPVSPFITEEIYQRLRSIGVNLKSPEGGLADSIMVSSFPVFDESECDEEAYALVEFIKEIIAAIRNLRAVVGLHPTTTVNVTLFSTDEKMRGKAESGRDLIANLGRVAELNITRGGKPANAIAQVVGGLEVFIPVEGLIDVSKEIERINRELEKLIKSLEQSGKKLSNRSFIDRAPEEVVEKERERFKELSIKKAKLQEILEALSNIG